MSSEHLIVSCFFLNQFTIWFATSFRSSPWRTSTNFLRVVHCELHRIGIKYFIALPPGFLFSLSRNWMSFGEIWNQFATCFQFFWGGVESISNGRIKSSISDWQSASLKSSWISFSRTQSLSSPWPSWKTWAVPPLSSLLWDLVTHSGTCSGEPTTDGLLTYHYELLVF